MEKLDLWQFITAHFFLLKKVKFYLSFKTFEVELELFMKGSSFFMECYNCLLTTFRPKGVSH